MGMTPRANRLGVTLVELFIVIFVISVVAALMVPAVIRARVVAYRVQSLNNLKQITLAAHSYSSMHRDEIPLGPIFLDLLPHLELESLWQMTKGETPYDVAAMRVTPNVLLNPLDPAGGTLPTMLELSAAWNTSYVVNAQVLATPRRLGTGISDGTSNTIFFSEQYGRQCSGRLTDLRVDSPAARPVMGGGGIQTVRPTFADGGPAHLLGVTHCGDFYPITTGQPPRSEAQGDRTFQAAPRILDCDPRMVQSTTSAGLQVSMADGSVRLVAPGVSQYAFWAAITPRSGEADVLP